MIYLEDRQPAGQFSLSVDTMPISGPMLFTLFLIQQSPMCFLTGTFSVFGYPLPKIYLYYYSGLLYYAAALYIIGLAGVGIQN